MDMEILEQLRPVFIDSFVEVYGEKHKKKIEEKCKAFRHRTGIEETIEYEFRKLEKELLKGE